MISLYVAPSFSRGCWLQHRQRQLGSTASYPKIVPSAPPDRSGLLIGANERLLHHREAALVSHLEELPELLIRRAGVAGLELPQKPRSCISPRPCPRL